MPHPLSFTSSCTVVCAAPSPLRENFGEVSATTCPPAFCVAEAVEAEVCRLVQRISRCFVLRFLLGIKRLSLEKMCLYILIVAFAQKGYFFPVKPRVFDMFYMGTGHPASSHHCIYSSFWIMLMVSVLTWKCIGKGVHDRYFTALS